MYSGICSCMIRLASNFWYYLSLCTHIQLFLVLHIHSLWTVLMLHPLFSAGKLCWEAPLEADSSISFYTISARNLNSTARGMDGTVTRNTTNNSTLFTLTGLLPGTTYEVTVVAVSQGGEVFAKSGASEPIILTTGFTGWYTFTTFYN